MNERLVLRVVARFQRQADQAPGARNDARKLTKPINTMKGIGRETVKEQVYTEPPADGAKVNRRDIQPSDVFQPAPRNINVVDFARKGWPGQDSDYKDMEKAIRNQIPKDKGYATVKNLSQYLIETDGGGGTRPAGK